MKIHKAARDGKLAICAKKSRNFALAEPSWIDEKYEWSRVTCKRCLNKDSSKVSPPNADK